MMPNIEKVLIIEDDLERAVHLCRAFKKMGLKVHYAHFDLDPDKQLDLDDARTREDLQQFDIVEDYSSKTWDEFLRMLDATRGNILVMLDHFLGDYPPSTTIRFSLARMIDESVQAGMTCFINCYSYGDPTVYEQLVDRAGYVRGGSAGNGSESFMIALAEQAIRYWEEATRLQKGVRTRIWPDEAVNYFRTHQFVQHTYSELQFPNEYNKAITRYLRALLLREPPATWFDGATQSKALHEALKHLIGGHAAAHLGYRMTDHSETPDETTVNNHHCRLTLGSLVLLLAAATAPNNAWIDQFTWRSQTKDAVRNYQTPKQCYRTAMAFADDTKGSEGLFTVLRTGDTDKTIPVIRSARLTPDGLVISLDFSIAIAKPDRACSLLDIWKFEGSERPGSFQTALDRAIDYTARYKEGRSTSVAVGLKQIRGFPESELLFKVL